MSGVRDWLKAATQRLRAMSPVVGTVLMLSIVVVLAAAILFLFQFSSVSPTQSAGIKIVEHSTTVEIRVLSSGSADKLHIVSDGQHIHTLTNPRAGQGILLTGLDPDAKVTVIEEQDGSNVTNIAYRVKNTTGILPSRDTHVISNDGASSDPVADISYTPSSPTVNETVTFNASASSDDGSIQSYEWDFTNDGTIDATGKVVNHTYTASGDYTVALTVTDNDSNTDTATATVSVSSNSSPVAAIDYSPSAPLVDETVTFNGSNSSATDGTMEKYEWDFDGDGSIDATGEVVNHTYSSSGDYTATLTVTDNGSTDTANETVSVSSNSSPVAAIDYSPSAPLVNETVTFNGSNSSATDGTMEKYEWDFNGDGSIDATGAVVNHTYTASGNYTVTLTVTDNGSTDMANETVSVSEDTSPVASIAYTPDKPLVDETVTFNGSNSTAPDGTMEKYEWDFTNDGTIDATGEVVNHTYTASGNYTVALTVTDNGSTDTNTTTVSVSSSDSTLLDGSWSSPVNLTSGDSADPHRRQIVRTEAGLITVLREGRDKMRPYISTDNGSTWTAGSTTFNGSTKIDLAVGAESGNNGRNYIHYVSKETGTDAYLRYANFTIGTDGSVTTNVHELGYNDDNGKGIIHDAGVTVDSTGNIYVVVAHEEQLQGNNYVHLNLIERDGGTWTDHGTFAGGTVQHQHPAFAVGGNDDIHIAWQRGGSPRTTEYIRYDASAGSFTSNETVVSDYFYGSIAINKSTNAPVIVSGYNGHLYKRSGGSWSSDQYTTESVGSASLTYVNSGLHVVYSNLSDDIKANYAGSFGKFDTNTTTVVSSSGDLIHATTRWQYYNQPARPYVDVLYENQNTDNLFYIHKNLSG